MVDEGDRAPLVAVVDVGDTWPSSLEALLRGGVSRESNNQVQRLLRTTREGIMLEAGARLKRARKLKLFHGHSLVVGALERR